MEEVIRISGEHTRVAAVEAALDGYARLRRKEVLPAVSGGIRLEENWRELKETELDE